ncbi:MAG: DUF3108 domain-containing protein [Bacteroidia bacterium]
MRFRLLVFCFLGVFVQFGFDLKNNPTPIVEPEYRPFAPGEFLKYNIHYGIVNAGEATFSVNDSLQLIKNKPHYKVRITGKSYKSWDLFYKVRDYYYSYIDSASMQPTVYSRNVQEGDYKDKESFWFKPKEYKAKGKNSEGELEIEIPNQIQDLASMIYYARSIKFYEKEQGFYLPMNVFFASEWYKCGAEFIGYENIKTTIGTFRCMKIIPKLVEGRVFKGQDDMVVYVSADENQIPIRIESEIFVGSIKVDLIEYENLKYPLRSKLD